MTGSLAQMVYVYLRGSGANLPKLDFIPQAWHEFSLQPPPFPINSPPLPPDRNLVYTSSSFGLLWYLGQGLTYNRTWALPVTLRDASRSVRANPPPFHS